MVERGPWFYMDSVPEPKVEANPVSWARRRALDAVMAWVRDREKRGTPLGPEREYVEGVTGITTISGAGKVYASEAVDRMEKLVVETSGLEMALLGELEDLATRHGARLEMSRTVDGLWTVAVNIPETMAMLQTTKRPLAEGLKRAIEFLDETDVLDGLVSASKAGGPA